jgi:hypothetical protein
MKGSTILFTTATLCLLAGTGMISARFASYSEYAENPPINVFIASQGVPNKKIESMNLFYNVAGLVWCLVGVDFYRVAMKQRKNGR